MLTNCICGNYMPILTSLFHILLSLMDIHLILAYTLLENKNEWQKTEPVWNLLPKASKNFLDVKTRNFFFYNWTSEMLPFIFFCKQMEPERIYNPIMAMGFSAMFTFQLQWELLIRSSTIAHEYLAYLSFITKP